MVSGMAMLGTPEVRLEAKRGAVEALSDGHQTSGYVTNGVEEGSVESLTPTKELVGERGFEPPTPWSRTRCSTRLQPLPDELIRRPEKKGNTDKRGRRKLRSNSDYSICCLHDCAQSGSTVCSGAASGPAVRRVNPSGVNRNTTSSRCRTLRPWILRDFLATSI